MPARKTAMHKYLPEIKKELKSKKTGFSEKTLFLEQAFKKLKKKIPKERLGLYLQRTMRNSKNKAERIFAVRNLIKYSGSESAARHLRKSVFFDRDPLVRLSAFQELLKTNVSDSIKRKIFLERFFRQEVILDPQYSKQTTTARAFFKKEYIDAVAFNKKMKDKTKLVFFETAFKRIEKSNVFEKKLHLNESVKEHLQSKIDFLKQKLNRKAA